jgi:hypothetical protein
MPLGLLVDPANFGDWGNNPVYHRIFEDSNVLVNVTLPGHQFHGADGTIGRDADGGVVFRRAMELPDGSIKIVSIGIGTGPDAGWNNNLAPILWDVNGARVSENAGAYTLNERPPWFLLADEGEAVAALNIALENGEVTIEQALLLSQSLNRQVSAELNEVIAQSSGSCFGPEASISMWPLDPEFAPDPNNLYKQYDQEAVRAKIWKKPIELIHVGDYVVSHDTNGNMVPGYVPRTMTNDAKILLNFHGTPVTPGHVYYRPDSKNSYKYETLIDVLRDDGMIEHSDVVKLRAATNVPVGTPRDGFVRAVIQSRTADGTLVQNDEGRIRLGTRFLVGEGKERKSFAVADLIEHGSGVVGDDELIRVGDGEPMPFLWDFSDMLPKPEDFVLACSGTTLEDIYKAAEWEGLRPHMPAPMVLDGGPVQPLSQRARSAMARNEPLSFESSTSNSTEL